MRVEILILALLASSGIASEVPTTCTMDGVFPIYTRCSNNPGNLPITGNNLCSNPSGWYPTVIASVLARFKKTVNGQLFTPSSLLTYALSHIRGYWLNKVMILKGLKLYESDTPNQSQSVITKAICDQKVVLIFTLQNTFDIVLAKSSNGNGVDVVDADGKIYHLKMKQINKFIVVTEDAK